MKEVVYLNNGAVKAGADESQRLYHLNVGIILKYNSPHAALALEGVQAIAVALDPVYWAAAVLVYGNLVTRRESRGAGGRRNIVAIGVGQGREEDA